MSHEARQLKQFAISAAVCSPIAAWLCGGGIFWIGTALVFGGAALGLAWYAPTFLRPFYRLLITLTRPIGMVVGEVTLWLIFVGVFVPIGYLFRLIGRDVLRRQFRSEAETYWQIVPGDTPVKQYWRRY